MSLPPLATALRELMALGVTGDVLIGAISRLEQAQIDSARPPIETTDERKKRISRETSARHRMSRNVTPASPNVTENDVTECHGMSPGDTNASPLARGEDNLLPLGITGKEDISEANASSSPSGDTSQKSKYPDLFESAWKAFPHVRGRSSKPKALTWWRKLTSDERTLLPGAVERYRREGREPKAECGAPAMDRWLRDQKFADWLVEQATGPPEPKIRLVYDPDFNERYRKSLAK